MKDMTMLQRLFSRNVPEQRVADAVERQTNMEAQEALRERSSVILNRLERKKAEITRAETQAREKERDEAERAAAEAQATEGAADTPQPVSESGDADLPVTAEATAETADAPPEMADAEPEETAATATEPVAEFQENDTDYGQDDAETGHVLPPFGHAAAKDDEPAMADEPDVSEITASRGDETLADESDPLEAVRRQELFSESGPLRRADSDDENTAPAEPDDVADPAPDEEPAPVRRVSDDQVSHADHDSSEADEELRRTAEEAKARIAARLQQMQGASGADPAPAVDNERVDLQEETPPIYHGDADNG
jgi:hypothetical protein